MIKGLYLLGAESYEKIYGPKEREEIAKLVDIYAPPQTAESVQANPEILADAEVVFSGWGCPTLDQRLLDAAPKLRAVFYGAGSIKQVVSPAFWERGIMITSAYAANGIPVVEFTIAEILFSLKRGWYYVRAIRELGAYPPRIRVPGAYGSTVGIISLGMIGRGVCERLRSFDVKVIAYDPYVSEAKAQELGVTLVSLEDIFTQSDVVSLHTPWLPETEGMITGEHFAMMPEGATFINTARGAVVREDEMIAVLRKRPDLWAILDVTYPAPPEPGSPLYTLPNVVLTPHIAGSLDRECERMGRYMVEELQRYLAGEPLRWQITKEQSAILA